jgi:PASTA domain
VTSYEEYEPGPPRGWSPFAVASIATLVLLLALAGSLFGIYVSDQNRLAADSTTETPPPATSGPVVTTTTTPPPTSTSPSPSATSPSGSPSPSAASSFPVPDLTNLDFQVAWNKLRDLKLGWDMKFEGATGDLTVSSTEPAAGTPVTKGTTVHVHVRGPAPLVAMPPVVGLPCDQAADKLTDAGSLVADYPAGRTGVVRSQDPLATDPPKLKWGGNGTKATITCG